MNATLTVPPELARIELGHGSHVDVAGNDCLCFMESVALLAGEGRTSTPATADQTITRMAIGINDTLDWTSLQGIKPLAPYVLGTRDDGLAERRLAYALRWCVTEFAPELLGRLGHWDRADELAEYFNLLPLEPTTDLSVWAGPLGAVQHARVGVHLRLVVGELRSVPKDEQEYQDVDAMLSRIIVALTDYNDRGQFASQADFIAHIAGELGHVFAVHLTYPFHKLDTMITRFLSELIFTGRSYL